LIFDFWKIYITRPGHEIVGKVHVKHIYEIAKLKLNDEHLKNME